MRRERMEWILLRGTRLPYRWTKKKVKNINLRVHRNGDLDVSSPMGTKREQIEAFLRANEEFIFRAIARWERQRAALPRTFSLEEGGYLPILGTPLEIRLSEDPPYGVTVEADRIHIHAASMEPEELRRVLRRWMGRRMEEWMPRLCREAADRMKHYGVSEPILRYRCMVGRWGSCCKAKGEITFNKFLLCAPASCIEYVVYHEMAHLVEANHSPAFYRILTELMPDWRSRKEELSSYGEWIREL